MIRVKFKISFYNLMSGNTFTKCIFLGENLHFSFKEKPLTNFNHI